MNKHQKYVNKKIELGVCAICNKPSLPYYYCSDCRFKRRLRYALNRMVKSGRLLKIKDKYINNPNKQYKELITYKVNPSGQKSRRKWILKNDKVGSFEDFAKENNIFN